MINMASWKMDPVSRALRGGIQLFKKAHCSFVYSFIFLYFKNCFESPTPTPTPTITLCARPVLSAGIMVLIPEFSPYQERKTWELMQSCGIREMPEFVQHSVHQRIDESYLASVREGFLAKGTSDLGFEG